jgi:monoamine oxidase
MARRVCKPSDNEGALEVAIVGSGLCGLALAKTLLQQGRNVRIFEARSRVGGRVDADLADVAAPEARKTPPARIDLGPTWYWPRSQPLMTQLVRELGLADFAQHDAKAVLVVNSPDDRARQVELGPVHGNARRLAGGMSTLIDALAASVPQEHVHLEHVLTAVHKRGRCIELHFQVGDELKVVSAERVVLAFPPRLVAERVQFEPALDTTLRSALQDAPTWMSTQAKVALAFERPEWRGLGHCGTAFVLHADAVLKEVFDACEEPQQLAALGAFIARAPAQRAALQDAVGEHVVRLFGLTQPAVRQHYRDWASEPYTCSARDLLEHSAQPSHPAAAAPDLRKSRWERRLFFAGSETAEVETGYMEGALHAAARVARELFRLENKTIRTVHPGRDKTLATVLPASTPTDRLTHFQSWLHEQRQPTLDDYKQRIATLLSCADHKQLTQKALLASVQQLFKAALEQLGQVQDGQTEAVHSRRDAALAPRVHEAVRNFLNALVGAVLSFNLKSPDLAALSAERRPSRVYAQAMSRAMYTAYRRFSRDATALLNPIVDPPGPKARPLSEGDAVDPALAIS